MPEWTLVVATDFSESGTRAAEYAATLAKPLDARLVLLHVVPWILYEQYALEEAVEGRRPDDLDRLLRRGGEELGRRLEAWEDLGLDVAVRTALGAPAKEICRVAREERASIVVVGAGGASGHRFGGVTGKTVRLAPCSVLVVPPNATVAAPRRLVAATDFSTAAGAVELTRRLATALEAEVRIVHALDPPTPDPVYGRDFRFDDAALRVHLDGKMQTIVREFNKTGGSARGEVVEGDPASTIVEYASAHGDLLLVGATGHGVIERLLVGTTTDRVMRSSPVPVVVCR